MFSSEIDNIVAKNDLKIRSKIDAAIRLKGDISDVSSRRARNGIYDFGAFQMANYNSTDFATFGGLSTSNVVGE